jgi:hypothetical protein
MRSTDARGAASTRRRSRQLSANGTQTAGALDSANDDGIIEMQRDRPVRGAICYEAPVKKQHSAKFVDIPAATARIRHTPRTTAECLRHERIHSQFRSPPKRVCCRVEVVGRAPAARPR